MGEMADYYNDLMQGAFPEWSPYSTTRVSPWGGSAPVTCKRCGKKNLHWVKTKEGWRMFNKKDKLHTCNIIKKYRKQFG